MSTSKQNLLRLLKTYSVLKGHFVLASGQTSDTYIDVRATALRSDGLCAIGETLFQLVQAIAPDVRFVGGLALGAVPITTAIAYAAGLNNIDDFFSVVVRKDAKGHGTKNMIEPSSAIERLNASGEGMELVAVDDVVTTAKSTL